ncbi:MAG: glycoside hydrolase family 26 protein, partial [Duncaniella sp.]|nr:glycoside hydrolase family 26 protein [Duncaniella sp.]
MNYASWIKMSAVLALVGCGNAKSVTDDRADDVSATPAQALIAQLDSVSRSGRFYFGHHDDTAYGHTWQYADGASDVKSVVGAYPGLMSWDLGLIEVDSVRNLDGVPFDFIASEIAKQYARGGVNAISWHALNPMSNGGSWDVSKAPLRNLETDKALSDTMDVWIARVAKFIGALRDSDGVSIPVIFRPWHENSGSWFWWGAEHGSPSNTKICGVALGRSLIQSVSTMLCGPILLTRILHANNISRLIPVMSMSIFSARISISSMPKM